MKIYRIVFIAIIFSLFSIVALQANDSGRFTGYLLWKVSGNGLEKPSYILGTHHLVNISFVDSISGLRSVIENTEQTVGELLMIDQASMQDKIKDVATFSEGESYQELLSTEDYNKLDNGLKGMFMAGLEQFGEIKPGVLSVLYTLALYARYYPEFNPMTHEAIDAYLQRIAQEKGKSVIGLETIEEQIQIIAGNGFLKEQAEALVQLVSNLPMAMQMIDKLNTCYKKGRLSEMYDLSLIDPSFKNELNTINKDRNDRWIKKLPQIMQEKSSLIAVGALHLAKEDGILHQLSQIGYNVEPVK